jgi:tetratricopeptide (TPR) repeat protein
MGFGVLGPTVPRELPGAVRHFTGREAELAALTALIGRATDQAPETVVISAIGGTAGVGKTALAVQWAHQAADRFPDGQLYVNLRGYDPDEPMPAADALAGFLQALGVPGQDIPVEADQRAARYRSLLAGRRMLVVLDNARSPEQVRPLLPGTPGCITLVTSRDSLTGLGAREGAVRLDLDVLSPAEALRLLRTLIGERVDAEPDAAAALARQCCRLPLALRVAAELAAARPAASLAHLTGELADLRTRLDLLGADQDPHTQVRTVFSWSYRHLGPDAARTFRLAALHPGRSLDPGAAAALTAATISQARRELDTLARAHLISAATPGRYALHDLLRAYARELAAGDRDHDRDAALTRLFDYYLHTVSAVMDVLFPAERHRRPRIADVDGVELPVMDPDAAREWLDAELPGLTNIVAHATEHGWPGHAVRIAAIIARYLNTKGLYAQACAVHRHALRAAQQARDATAETDALLWLGNSYAQQGRQREASTCWSRALARAQAIGYPDGQAGALNYLGFYADRTGQYSEAISCLEQARSLHARTGNRIGVAYSLSNLGVIRQRQGDYERAVAYHERALSLFRECGDQYSAILALWRLGATLLRLGHYDQAGRTLRQALMNCQEFGDEQGAASIRVDIGLLHLAEGETHQATGELQYALEIFREIGDVHSQAEALNGLGETSLATGSFTEAHEQHGAALRLATQTADPREQARAHLGHGHASHGLGQSAEAFRHWRRALRIYTQLSVPEADQVRATIAAAELEAGRQRVPCQARS